MAFKNDRKKKYFENSTIYKQNIQRMSTGMNGKVIVNTVKSVSDNHCIILFSYFDN